jgi:hypothetical protein
VSGSCPSSNNEWNCRQSGEHALLRKALSAYGEEAFSCPCSFFTSSCLARSKTLTKLAQDWEDVLKRASEKADR